MNTFASTQSDTEEAVRAAHSQNEVDDELARQDKHANSTHPLEPHVVLLKINAHLHIILTT